MADEKKDEGNSSSVNTVVAGVEPGGLPVIPAEYAGMGLETGYAPKPAEELRMFVVGPSGEGKTTLASSIPDNLILDFEGGAGGIIGTRSVRVAIKGYDHYMQVTDKLIADGKAGRHPFKRVTFDPVDEWAALISMQLAVDKKVEDIAEYGSKGSGWSLLKNRCWSRVRELQQAGYAWTCVGHLVEKTVTNPITKQEMTVVRPSVFPGLAECCKRNSEFYGAVYSLSTQEIQRKKIKLPDGRTIEVDDQSNVKNVTKYYFDCRAVAGREGKMRGVPDMKSKIELPLINGWDKFVTEYEKAVKDNNN